ncbi:MAG: 50S ribosomal protein L10 [Gemmatimonadota bacterium]
MNKTDKQSIVTDLGAKLKGARSIYVTDFQGLNVARVSDLRRRLRKAGVEYVVVKNTLARRALLDAAVGGLDDHLHGATALALTAQDPAAAAKVLTEFAKEFQKPSVKAAVIEGRAVTPAQVKRLVPERGLPLAGQVVKTRMLSGPSGSMPGLSSRVRM